MFSTRTKCPYKIIFLFHSQKEQESTMCLLQMLSASVLLPYVLMLCVCATASDQGLVSLRYKDCHGLA